MAHAAASHSSTVSPTEAGTPVFWKGTAVTRRLRSSALSRRTDRVQNPQVPSNTRVRCGGHSAMVANLIICLPTPVNKRSYKLGTCRSSRRYLPQQPHTGLANRTGGHLTPRGPAVLQYQLRRPSGAGHAGVDQEALRSDPVSGKVKVVQARHPRVRSAGEAAFSGGGERADGLDARQVLAPDQRTAPARLRRLEQVFEVALVLARVPRIPRVELLEGDNQGRPFGGDAGVDRLGAHEPWSVQVLHHRTIGDRQALQGHVEASDPRGAQPVHQLAPSAVYVVDRVPERALNLLDEELRADEVQRRAVDEGARERRHQPAQLRATHLEVEQFLDARLRQGARSGRAKRDEETYERQLVSRVQHVGAQEPERVRREGAQLALLQHKGVFRDAVIVVDAQLLEDPRGRAAGVEGVPATVEQEAVELPGRRAAAQVGRLLKEGHAHPLPSQVAGGGEPRHPAPDNHDVRL